MQNDTNAPDVGNKDGLAGGDLAGRCRAESAEHQTVYADDRRRKALFAEAATRIDLLEAALTAADRLMRDEYDNWTGAGGPDECAHGYAAGIPCLKCDDATFGKGLDAVNGEPANQGLDGK